MASYTLVKNTSILIDLPIDMSDQGWVISGDIAYHSGCNSGYIEKRFDLSSAAQWTFRYTIIEFTFGSLNIVVDGQVGVSRTAAGTYEETFSVTGVNKLIRFFSTGKNAIKLLKIFQTINVDNAITLAFNEAANKWVTYYSFKPDFMIKFGNDFFTSRDGELWLHNVNEIRNNFYDVQYTSRVVFIFNFEYKKNKLVFNLRLNSKGAWYAPIIQTAPSDEFPNGMRTRLKKNNFKLKSGKMWADVLRDLTDPAFSGIIDPAERALKALFNGRKIQCGTMTIELECADTTEAKLAAVEVYYTEAERNF